MELSKPKTLIPAAQAVLKRIKHVLRRLRIFTDKSILLMSLGIKIKKLLHSLSPENSEQLHTLIDHAQKQFEIHAPTDPVTSLLKEADITLKKIRAHRFTMDVSDPQYFIENGLPID